MTLLSVSNFAQWSGIAKSTVRLMCKQKKLPAKKFGVKWFIDKDLFIKQTEAEMQETKTEKPCTDIEFYLARKKKELFGGIS